MKCVQYKQFGKYHSSNDVARLKDDIAHRAVKDGIARYIPKKLYKRYRAEK